MGVAGVRLNVSLRLPRDAAGLQLVRAVTDPALAAHGVSGSCRHDIALALTEACGNAIRHATGADEYEMSMKIANGLCVIEVTDHGPGFHINGAPTKPAANAPSGRGLYIIDQLADHFHVDTHPGRGTTVQFVKQLVFTTDVPDPQQPLPNTAPTHI